MKAIREAKIRMPRITSNDPPRENLVDILDKAREAALRPSTRSPRGRGSGRSRNSGRRVGRGPLA